MTTNYQIQRSIETQTAAKELGISKPKMARIVKIVEREYPHHPVDMMADDISSLYDEIGKEICDADLSNDSSEIIASALIDLWQVIY